MPVLRSAHLPNQVREHIWYRHYSLQTEKNYLSWVSFSIRWHGRNGVMCHQREMDATGMEALFQSLNREITWLLQVGAKIRTAQKILEHSDVSTTISYTHVLISAVDVKNQFAECSFH